MINVEKDNLADIEKMPWRPMPYAKASLVLRPMPKQQRRVGKSAGTKPAQR